MHGLLLPVNGKLMWVWKNKKKQIYKHTCIQVIGKGGHGRTLIQTQT